MAHHGDVHKALFNNMRSQYRTKKENARNYLYETFATQPPKIKPEIVQNPLLEPSWRLLEPSWGLLGPSWAPPGPVLQQNLGETCFGSLNSGAKIHHKLQKSDVKKGHVLRYVFLIEISSILHRFWILKTIIFGPNLVIK